jgi:Ca-activated chloride channel family protein
MFNRGPSYLSAAVLYENLIVEQETKRLSGESSQLPVVAIYPKEGTFWSNHPYVILNAPWVNAEQREAAEAFEDFLLAQAQQVQAIEYGFRPADPAIPLTAPLDAEHGVDPNQPQTILEAPPADVTQAALQLWQQTKKPVDLIVVMDISGSMSGEKINSARQSLIRFIDLLDDGDRLQITLFSDEIFTITPLSPLGEKREEVERRVSGVIEGGDTSLYDAVAQSYAELLAQGDPKHIKAMVVLTDGQDTSSLMSLNQVVGELNQSSEEGGNAPKLFTIAFGDDADKGVLQQMSEITGGKQYDSDPQSIDQIYNEIATFF